MAKITLDLRGSNTTASGETFKRISGYGGFDTNYYISNMGRLFRRNSDGTETFMNPTKYTNKTGLKYHQFRLKKDDGTVSYVPVHRILANVFLDDSFPIEYSSEDGRVINHKDGNSLNNSLYPHSNIEVTTQSNNIKHAMDVLGRQVGKKREQVLVQDITTGDYSVFKSTHDAMRFTGMNNPGTINNYLKNGYTYKNKFRVYYLDNVIQHYLDFNY